MRPGPSTFRPHVAIEELAKVIATRDLPNVPVTTSAGELIGLLSARMRSERCANAREARHEMDRKCIFSVLSSLSVAFWPCYGSYVRHGL
jgi:hypothetical protein